MNKQVEQIKAEIERLYLETQNKYFTGELLGYRDALRDILEFIDSLEEEPASEDLIKVTNRYYHAKN